MQPFDQTCIVALFEKYGPLATYSQLAKQMLLPPWKINQLFDEALKANVIVHWPQVTTKGEVVYLLLCRKKELPLKQRFAYWFMTNFCTL